MPGAGREGISYIAIGDVHKIIKFPFNMKEKNDIKKMVASNDHYDYNDHYDHDGMGGPL